MKSAAAANGSGSGSGGGGRNGRLPRWTRKEIMVLIEAKRAYEKQCGSGAGRPTEPKWTLVSSWCRRQGVERGPLQCRKRWSNLACEFNKIRGWEGRRKSGGHNNHNMESYWMMRSDVRREKKLPGVFDREVFELMDEEIKEEEDVVFDGGRSAREDGLFSEFEPEEEEEEEEEDDENEGTTAGAGVANMLEPMLVVPISERKYLPENEHSDPGNSNDNQQQTYNNPEKGSSSWERQKRQRTSEDGAQETCLGNKLIKALEKNTMILSAQLEAHNLNCQLDRDQRKDQADGLLAVMTRLADALGRIADKLD